MIKNKKINHKITYLLPQLVKVLKADKDIIFAYLFGSYGRGRILPLSDIDIALYLSDELDNFYLKKMDLIEIVNKILITDEVDLVILNEAPLYLQFEIIKTGKLLFCHNHLTRIKFQSKIMMFYLDTERLRQIGRAALFKRYRR